jgi:hypothetical protein
MKFLLITLTFLLFGCAKSRNENPAPSPKNFENIDKNGDALVSKSEYQSHLNTSYDIDSPIMWTFVIIGSVVFINFMTSYFSKK